MPTVAAPSLATTVAMVMPNPAPTVPAGPRPAFTILRESTPAAAREYASLPLVRPWRELARAVDPIGRLPLDAGAVWAGDVEGALALPAHFDGRRRWGRLLTSLRDQGLSGACWAFAVVSALGDRAALWTHGAVRAWPDGIARPGVFSGLAPRDIIDCDFDALTDAQIEGEADIVSANEIHHGHRHADYGHTLAGAAEVLYVGGVACEGGWRCRSLAHYALASNTEMDVKAEIFAWGPVASAFALYEDFMYPERHPASWLGGVYRHDPAACPRAFGGHAVVIVAGARRGFPHCRRLPCTKAGTHMILSPQPNTNGTRAGSRGTHGGRTGPAVLIPTATLSWSRASASWRPTWWPVCPMWPASCSTHVTRTA
ncbi:papain family cysteine protease [Pandoravirus inopinatum]|uniref:Papain family cysteine protease n=1 Tax=Pandoravirus inopinatum TaxID=1605721 RepID=A0A0B5J2Y7_9VIRU|nr:papain family cysteine protease [Pandoravirus inopinatum]AJF97954.1 papain family cysteine protease [Pandoravirus inopinatum]